MKIGLFFGSFNPVHVGHLVIAQAVLNETELERVWMVVSPQNPFKQKKNLLREYDRLRIVELATEDNRDIEASNVEFVLPTPSYTVDTLLHLSEKLPSHDFSLVMGEDNLAHLHKWKNYEAILEHYPIYCYPRLGKAEDQAMWEKYPQVTRFEMPYLDISATRIRNMIRKGKDVRYLIPDGAYEYLKKEEFYSE